MIEEWWTSRLQAWVGTLSVQPGAVEFRRRAGGWQPSFPHARLEPPRTPDNMQAAANLQRIK